MGCGCGKAKIARPAASSASRVVNQTVQQMSATAGVQVVRSQSAPVGTAPVTPKMTRPQV